MQWFAIPFSWAHKPDWWKGDEPLVSPLGGWQLVEMPTVRPIAVKQSDWIEAFASYTCEEDPKGLPLARQRLTMDLDGVILIKESTREPFQKIFKHLWLGGDSASDTCSEIQVAYYYANADKIIKFKEPS